MRRYEEADVKRLRFIRTAQAAGFTLAEIAHLLELDRTADRHAIRDLAAARIEALDDKIHQLAAARSALARLAKECESGASGPCPIVEAFDRGS